MNDATRHLTGRRVVLIGLAIVFGVAAALFFAHRAFDRAQVIERSFATRAAAESAQYVGPDQRIPVLPSSAVRIRHAHDSDSNDAWMQFAFASEDSVAVVGTRRRLVSQEVAALDFSAPRWLKWWEPEVRAYRSAGVHNTAVYMGMTRGQPECVAVNWSTKTAMVWSCDA